MLALPLTPPPSPPPTVFMNGALWGNDRRCEDSNVIVSICVLERGFLPHNPYCCSGTNGWPDTLVYCCSCAITTTCAHRGLTHSYIECRGKVKPGRLFLCDMRSSARNSQNTFDGVDPPPPPTHTHFSTKNTFIFQISVYLNIYYIYICKPLSRRADDLSVGKSWLLQT